MPAQLVRVQKDKHFSDMASRAENNEIEPVLVQENVAKTFIVPAEMSLPGYG